MGSCSSLRSMAGRSALRAWRAKSVRKRTARAAAMTTAQMGKAPRPILSRASASAPSPRPVRTRPRISAFPGIGLADIGHDAQRERDAQQADGQVDEEDPAPGGICRDEAADQRADGGADQSGNGDIAHGLDELGLGDRAQQHQPAHRRHHGAAHALKHPRGDHLRQVLGQAAQHRADREEGDGGDEDIPPAEAVGQPAAGGDEDRQAEEIGGHGHAHGERALAQAAGHGGQGRRDHGGIEILHEQREGHDQRQDDRCPLRLVTGGEEGFRHESGKDRAAACGEAFARISVVQSAQDIEGSPVGSKGWSRWGQRGRRIDPERSSPRPRNGGEG